MQSVTLSLFRFGTMGDRLWAFAQMGLARFAVARIPGIGFHTLCGSGSGEGFTPLPNTAVYGLLATWESLEVARVALETAPIIQRYRRRSVEHCTWFLNARSSRGFWSGQEPFTIGGTLPKGPIAALTRATIKPSIMMKFWGRVPAISDVIGSDPNVIFKIGVGEVPWFHQVTFSVWPNTRAMDNFARTSGPHGQAIRAVRDGKWFSEELYARFAIQAVDGSWDGQPLQQKLEHAA